MRMRKHLGGDQDQIRHFIDEEMDSRVLELSVQVNTATWSRFKVTGFDTFKSSFILYYNLFDSYKALQGTQV